MKREDVDGCDGDEVKSARKKYNSSSGRTALAVRVDNFAVECRGCWREMGECESW